MNDQKSNDQQLSEHNVEKRVFSKLLIANRGEIAVRIIRACRQLNILSVAVYSTADRHALHVHLADEAVCIGEPAASDSYLNIDGIIKAASQLKAQAIHPGYGFLAENPAFAEACAASGITFIGPTADSMHAVANKHAARALVQALNIPVIPGLKDLAHFDDSFIDHCATMGYPLLLKAAAGGGGLGMRVVENVAALEEAFKAVRREAQQAFGDSTIITEKYLAKARHIEVQILADHYGHTVHLHERDCSVQRRRQKIIEESPARNLAPGIKQALCQSALAISEKLAYRGAGTVEFLVAEDGQYYFLEMNTRLQVEHGVTEAVTGIDIVQWQIRIAEGEALNINQQDIPQHGHAIECRICAENPSNNFTPASGTIHHRQAPNNVRCDSGLHPSNQQQGREANSQNNTNHPRNKVSVYYDSLLAKLISYGEDFASANRAMQAALANTTLLGLDSNLNYLANIVASTPWQVLDIEDLDKKEGARDKEKLDIDTQAVDRHHELWCAASDQPQSDKLLCTALAVFNQQENASTASASSFWPGQRQRRQHWQITGENRRQHCESARTGANAYSLWLAETGVDAAPFHCTILSMEALTNNDPLDSAAVFSLQIEINEHHIHAMAAINGRRVFIHSPTLGRAALTIGSDQQTAHTTAIESVISAPMPAKIVAVSVAVGDSVERDQELLLLESMKMESRLTAKRSGIIKTVLVTAGELVESNQALIEFEDE